MIGISELSPRLSKGWGVIYQNDEKEVFGLILQSQEISRRLGRFGKILALAADGSKI